MSTAIAAPTWSRNQVISGSAWNRARVRRAADTTASVSRAGSATAAAAGSSDRREQGGGDLKQRRAVGAGAGP